VTATGRRRLLGAIAASGPLAFMVAWVIASALQSGYDPARDAESALAALGADHPWITITGELLLGAGTVALAAGLATTLPGRDVAVGSALLLTAGVAIVVQALAREDCVSQLASCAARERAGDVSWHHTLHGMASGLAFFALPGASLVLARPFRIHRHWHALAAYSVITAILGLLALVTFVGTADTSWGGLSEGVFITVLLAWIVVVGIRLSQRPPVPSSGS
jgi:hypothetical membrane protein